jgi:hypothetical protein
LLARDLVGKSRAISLEFRLNCSAFAELARRNAADSSILLGADTTVAAVCRPDLTQLAAFYPFWARSRLAIVIALAHLALIAKLFTGRAFHLNRLKPLNTITSSKSRSSRYESVTHMEHFPFPCRKAGPQWQHAPQKSIPKSQ